MTMCAHSCLTLCKPIDCSPLGPSVHGIFQARILEQVAISFSRGSSQPRDWIQISCIADSLPSEPQGKPASACAKLLRSSLTACNTMDYSPPGSSVHGILQSRMLVWLPFLGDLPNPGVKPASPALAGKFFTTEKPGKPLNHTQIQNKNKKNFKDLYFLLPMG